MRDPAAADALAETFRADAEWRDTIPWDAFRAGRRFERRAPANGSFPTGFDPAAVGVDRASVLVAPEDAGDTVVARLDAAEESVDVLQVSVGSPDQRFLHAARRAAERGVEVRVPLSDA